MSLDQYLQSYTSEDNASFTVLMEEHARAQREKFAWAYVEEYKAAENTLRLTNQSVPALPAPANALATFLPPSSATAAAAATTSKTGSGPPSAAAPLLLTSVDPSTVAAPAVGSTALVAVAATALATMRGAGSSHGDGTVTIGAPTAAPLQGAALAAALNPRDVLDPSRSSAHLDTDARHATPASWPYRARNPLMYYPEGGVAEQSLVDPNAVVSTRNLAPPKAIHAAGTRFGRGALAAQDVSLRASTPAHAVATGTIDK
jgi:hypothetical protein